MDHLNTLKFATFWILLHKPLWLIQKISECLIDIQSTLAHHEICNKKLSLSAIFIVQVMFTDMILSLQLKVDITIR